MDATIKNEGVQKTNWNQILSLAALNAAVVISWIAYHNYQPAVLKGFGFQDLSLFLTLSQALILTLIPPVAGLLGDYLIRKNGKRFIVFTVGTSATAMIFMAVASMLEIGPGETMKMVLPVMIVLWLISMNIFHSPANSMLDHFAPSQELPLVMAVITMVTELLYALEPIVIDLVNWLGGTQTFITGGVLLVVTGFFFLRSTRNLNEQANTNDQIHINRKNNYPMIALIGLTFGLITAFIMEVFPELLRAKLPDYSSMFGGAYFSSLILGMAALLVIPLSSTIKNIGLVKGLIIGLFVAAISILAILFLQSQILILIFMIILSIGFGLSAVSAFPYTLNNLNPRNLTFGAGIFFGCVELASGVFAVLKELGYTFV